MCCAAPSKYNHHPGEVFIRDWVRLERSARAKRTRDNTEGGSIIKPAARASERARAFVWVCVYSVGWFVLFLYVAAVWKKSNGVLNYFTTVMFIHVPLLTGVSCEKIRNGRACFGGERESECRAFKNIEMKLNKSSIALWKGLIIFSLSHFFCGSCVLSRLNAHCSRERNSTAVKDWRKKTVCFDFFSNALF